MSDLLRLPEHLLELIASKFEWKSYFRMQQTCHDMANLIKTNRNVMVFRCMDSSSTYLEITSTADGLPEYILHILPRWKRSANFESLYGIRFDYVRINTGEKIADNFLTSCCDILRKYRITAEEIDTFYLDGCTYDEYETLLKILKPVKARQNGYGSNIFLALLQGKELKDVQFSIRPEDIPDLAIMKNFLEKFLRLRVEMYTDEIELYFHQVYKILQNLGDPPPKLGYFTFVGWHTEYEKPLPQANELLEVFQDFNPVLKAALPLEYGSESVIQYTFECRLGPDHRLCKLDINRRFIKIIFGDNNGDKY